MDEIAPMTCKCGAKLTETMYCIPDKGRRYYICDRCFHKEGHKVGDKVIKYQQKFQEIHELWVPV